MVVRAEIHATAAEIEEIEERLERFVEELGFGTDAQTDEDGELGDERYRLLIAFFPVES